MDISNFNLAAQAEAGYVLELTHPATGERLGGFITVRGDESKAVQNYNRKRFTEMQKREKRNKGKDNDYTLEEIEDIAIESAIVRVISWKNIKKDGEELAFTKENAEMVFREYPWIRKQVMEAAEDLLNFRSE